MCRPSSPCSGGGICVRHTPQQQGNEFPCHCLSPLGNSSCEYPGAGNLGEAGTWPRAEPTCTASVSWLQGVWAFMAFDLPSSDSHLSVPWALFPFTGSKITLVSRPPLCYYTLFLPSVNLSPPPKSVKCAFCPRERTRDRVGLVKTSDRREGSPVAESHPQPLPHHLTVERYHLEAPVSGPKTRTQD